MKKIALPALMLSFAVVLYGCKSAPVPSKETSETTRPSAPGDGYNRGYETESRHHHHRRDRDSADASANDNRSSYDQDEEGSSASEEARQSPRAQGQRHHNKRALTAAPGQFDFYVLTLSWSPEYCHSHATAPECAQHRAFTLHGLWPENTNGTYPEDCSDAPGPANPSQYSDIYPDPSLLQHEWQTHGTCSGLSADQFFTLARRADQSVQVPAELAHLSKQISMTPAQIVTLFTRANKTIPAASLAISCGNNYLTAVEVCESKTLGAVSCSGLKTCGATQVRILPPPGA